MTIVLNTLETNDYTDEIDTLVSNMGNEVEMIKTSEMNISHCLGCNHCFLKTPGVCAIKDDYEQILRKLAGAQNLWLISDTRFGFIDYRGKRVMDRILPMLNMNIEFRNGRMRHSIRYVPLNVGLIYKGHGVQDMLEEWCERTSDNLGGHSLGATALMGRKEDA